MPIPQLNPNLIRQQIRRLYGSTQQWIAYTGPNQLSLTPILDWDGNTSFIESASAPTMRSLALAESFDTSLETFRLTVAGDNAPDANQTYWASFDGGATKVKLEHVSRRVCQQGAFTRIILQRR